MGKRSWLDQALQENYLPAIAALENSEQGRQEAAQLCQELRQSWEQRGFSTLEQQQSLMDTTRRAIKQRLGKDHFSLDHIGFSTQEYTDLNDLKQGRVAERNTRCVLLDPGSVNALVTRSVNLLNSQEWPEIAAALAVLTGRRSTEVIATAQFLPKTQYSVVFTGALKRGGEEQMLSFEIPTLCQAEYVLKGLKQLRALVNVEGLSRQQINARYGQKVADACDRLFADLIPTRPDHDTLYSHLFRALYATIAVWFYCPVSVDATEFKAHCQGHFALLDEHNPQLRRQLASSRHYSDFKISDAQGNIDGRQGIRLNWQGVEVLEVFQQAAKAAQPTITQRKHPSSLRIWKDNHARLLAMLDRFEGKTQADRVAAWLEWSEQQLAIQAIQPSQESGAEGTDQATGEAIAPVRAEDKTSAPHEAIEGPGPLSTPEPAMGTTEVAPTHQDAVPLERQLAELVLVLRQFVEVQAAAFAPQAASPARDGSGKATRPSTKSTKGDRAQEKRDADHTLRELQQPSRAGRKRGDDDDIIDRAISAIIAYNDAPDRSHDQKWFLTPNLLKKFTPNLNQRAAQRALDRRAAEVHEHHLRHQLQPDHNNRHKKHLIQQIVTV
jgi:hypothetical protein